MNCNQIGSCLDRLLDDELSAEELEALEAHAAHCEACASELRAARGLKAMMADMAPEMDVPLEAQAKWRGVIRQEAAVARRKRWYRYAGGIAAALVVLLGASLLMRPAPSRGSAPMMAMEAAGAADLAKGPAQIGMIEADGTMDVEAAGEEAVIADAAPMCEVTVRVDDLDEACGYIADLIEEYEGTMDEQRFESDGAPCANLFIKVPGESASEFLNAVAGCGECDALPERDYAVAGETSMLLVLRAK